MRGTRLVSLRVAAMALIREVERERRPLFVELNQKLIEARCRVDAAKQMYVQAVADPSPADPRAAGLLEREIYRAQAKLAELHAQKAMKLFSMISMCRRVACPYVYLNGEASPMPPGGQLDPERPQANI